MMGTATMQHSRKSEEFWSGVRQELPLIVGVAPFGLVYGVLGVARVVNNDFHKERKEFRYPKWWGSKPWHRGGKKRGDVRIPKHGNNEVWTKADL